MVPDQHSEQSEVFIFFWEQMKEKKRKGKIIIKIIKINYDSFYLKQYFLRIKSSHFHASHFGGFEISPISYLFSIFLSSLPKLCYYLNPKLLRTFVRANQHPRPVDNLTMKSSQSRREAPMSFFLLKTNVFRFALLILSLFELRFL